MKVEHKFILIIVAIFATIAVLWFYQVSPVNIMPIMVFIFMAVILVLALQYFSKNRLGRTTMSPFEAMNYVSAEWENFFHEKITVVDSAISPFYIPGTASLFYSMRIHRPSGEGKTGNITVPVVLNVVDKHVYWELYPTAEQQLHPYKIIVPEGITVTPVEKFTPEAMNAYWNRRYSGGERQVFNIGEKRREHDELDKLRGTTPEDDDKKKN